MREPGKEREREREGKRERTQVGRHYINAYSCTHLQTQQHIVLPDPSSSSSTPFAGLGAVSSETTTLLPDFEPAVREEIYDALFRRRGGAQGEGGSQKGRG